MNKVFIRVLRDEESKHSFEKRQLFYFLELIIFKDSFIILNEDGSFQLQKRLS
jgi:hypothetical protein